MEAFEWIELVAFAGILVVLWDTRSCMRDIERQLLLLSGGHGRSDAKD